MNKREMKITKADGARIAKAREAIDDLYQLTRKYLSTQTLKSNVEARLDVLSAWFAANAGYVLYKGMRFPYRDAELRRCESDAKQIYSFAFGKNNNRKAVVLWVHINKVFDRVRAIAQWLEDAGGKEK